MCSWIGGWISDYDFTVHVRDYSFVFAVRKLRTAAGCDDRSLQSVTSLTRTKSVVVLCDFAVIPVNYCLSNAMQCMALDRYKITWVYVCVSVCPKYLSSAIATAVFVRSSSNLECGSHIWQQRLSSMANNTGSSKRACASIYFRFSSFLGLCPR